MRVRVVGGVADLRRDMESIATRVRPDMRGVVRDGIRVGKMLARENARASSGPHGKSFHKRINAEMTGDLEGEFGPDGTPKTEFVGAGFRHGVNTDLPRAADVVGPAFLRSVDDKVKDWFW